MKEPILILMKPLILAIPTDDEELRELRQDLRAKGCEGLLDKPWNIQLDVVLRKFRFERGNQWEGTKRRDPENWTVDTWARVYGFQMNMGKDGLAVRMVCLPESSKRRLIRRRASTLRTA